MRSLCLLVLLAGTAAAQSPAAPRWFKGNTHVHTLASDGDSSPSEVSAWYKERGYHFLVISDHNVLVAVDSLNQRFAEPGRFLVLPGEEVTDRFENKPIHVNGLVVERLVQPQGGSSVVQVVQRNVDAIRAAKGVPHVNHPNFGWAIAAQDLARIRNTRLFEVFNGHPLVNNVGGGGMPGLEEMWDIILSGGTLLYGLATDDAHHFKRPNDFSASLPGRGWIYVRAERLDAPSLLAALERGDFYASTGVELEDVVITPKRYEVRVKVDRLSRYTIQFIGRDGRVLAERNESTAVYEPRGDEGYVRAKVIESNGKYAWTQPVLVGGR